MITRSRNLPLASSLRLSPELLSMCQPGKRAWAPSAMTNPRTEERRRSVKDVSFPPWRTVTLETAQKIPSLWLKSPERAPFSSMPICFDRTTVVCQEATGFPERDALWEFLSQPWLVDRSQPLGEKQLLSPSQRGPALGDTAPRKENTPHPRTVHPRAPESPGHGDWHCVSEGSLTTMSKEKSNQATFPKCTPNGTFLRLVPAHSPKPDLKRELEVTS